MKKISETRPDSGAADVEGWTAPSGTEPPALASSDGPPTPEATANHVYEGAIDGFAVFPDGATAPGGVFADLEDAIEWGLQRYGADAFSIRYLSVASIERAEDHGSPGPV